MICIHSFETQILARPKQLSLNHDFLPIHDIQSLLQRLDELTLEVVDITSSFSLLSSNIFNTNSSISNQRIRVFVCRRYRGEISHPVFIYIVKIQ